jgi:hypothetical protein
MFSSMKLYYIENINKRARNTFPALLFLLFHCNNNSKKILKPRRQSKMSSMIDHSLVQPVMCNQIDL